MSQQLATSDVGLELELEPATPVRAWLERYGGDFLVDLDGKGIAPPATGLDIEDLGGKDHVLDQEYQRWVGNVVDWAATVYSSGANRALAGVIAQAIAVYVFMRAHPWELRGGLAARDECVYEQFGFRARQAYDITRIAWLVFAYDLGIRELVGATDGEDEGTVSSRASRVSLPAMSLAAVATWAKRLGRQGAYPTRDEVLTALEVARSARYIDVRDTYVTRPGKEPPALSAPAAERKSLTEERAAKNRAAAESIWAAAQAMGAALHEAGIVVARQRRGHLVLPDGDIVLTLPTEATDAPRIVLALIRYYGEGTFAPEDATWFRTNPEVARELIDTLEEVSGLSEEIT